MQQGGARRDNDGCAQFGFGRGDLGIEAQGLGTFRHDGIEAALAVILARRVIAGTRHAQSAFWNTSNSMIAVSESAAASHSLKAGQAKIASQ